jgi:hypothetical protein
MTCLSSIKFNLIATVVRNYQDNIYDDENPGGFQEVYDELTGEVRQVWVAADLIPNDGSDQVITQIPCAVYPLYTVSQANDVKYENGGSRVIDTERLVMKVPSKYHLFTTDRVMSITDRSGMLIFEDDQNPKRTENLMTGVTVGVPTIYNITGVMPVMDPFGRVIERQVQLEKSN